MARTGGKRRGPASAESFANKSKRVRLCYTMRCSRSKLPSRISDGPVRDPHDLAAFDLRGQPL